MRSLLAQLDNSALSTRDFAELHGMSVIYWWRSELRRRDRERGQDFVEVDIRPDATIVASQSFEIALPCGLRIVVPRARRDGSAQSDRWTRGVYTQPVRARADERPPLGVCNRSKNRIQVPNWETSGYWLLLKRLEKSRFARPNASDASSLSLSPTELHALLGGLDFERARRRNWYNSKPRNV